jgi:CheY-like chemotaxis protein
MTSVGISMKNSKENDEIVIVDDSPFDASFIVFALHSAGFCNTIVFDDPTEALAYVKQNVRPAVVITDFKMPKLSGIELLKEIVSHLGEIDAIIVTTEPFLAKQTPHGYTVLEKTYQNQDSPLSIVRGIVERRHR